MKIDRLLSIVILLLNRERVPAKVLAETFDVSIRTIYRDIDSINQAGIPVVSFPGNTGGFGIMSNYRLDSRVLSFQDLVTVLTTLKGVQGVLDDQELDQAIEKLDSLVPQQHKDQALQYEEQFVVDILPWGYRQKQKDALSQIYRAISGNKLISIRYHNAQGQTISRVIEPMTLLFKGYAWYVFAFCRYRQDFRIFRLSRMREICFPSKGFIRRKANWRDYYEPDRCKSREITLVLLFSSSVRFRVEDYFGPENVTDTVPGRLKVKFAFPYDEWIYSFLLSFGEEVEVLSPPDVRRRLAQKVRKITAMYRN